MGCIKTDIDQRSIKSALYYGARLALGQRWRPVLYDSNDQVSVNRELASHADVFKASHHVSFEALPLPVD